jgi:hypothetical protein
LNFLIQSKSDDEEGSGSGETETTTRVYSDDPTVRRCHELDGKVVKPFTKCCQIPRISLPNEVYDACVETFEHEKCTDSENCCLTVCVYKKIEIIKFIVDAQIRPDFYPEGMIQNLLYTVRENGMDEVWEPVVRRAVNRCFDDFEGAVEGYYCNQTIPKLMSEVGYCCYKELFMNCPNYNNQDAQCSINLEYMRECWTDLDTFTFGL